ncbi:hypothetical protein M407DRAFT_57338, partial [Tulasnella calospora MUT 4182]
EKPQMFATAVDNQITVTIHVFEGEHTLINLLSKFELNGIPPAPCRAPQIEVSCKIDTNGILKVGTVEKGTGKPESIQSTNSKG